LALTQDEFDAMLAWFAPDREQAGRKYEDIRRRLIKIFTCRGCHDAETWADVAISRVASKVCKLAPSYVGDPALYFYAVAKNVYKESLRQPSLGPAPSPASDPTELEREDACLAHCLQKLARGQRDMFQQYHCIEQGRTKIEQRQKLARRLGIELNALRIRVHRIRTKLQECMEDCLAASAA
jgi:DNA-directed RNA polymerase specialized sigma24 family protein